MPALLIHMSVVAIPALSTVVMSLYDWNGIGEAKMCIRDSPRTR